jgi:hypothetical protein
MVHTADPPNEGRCGSFFAPGKPWIKAANSGPQPGTKSYYVLQNYRRRCSGAVYSEDSHIDDSGTFILSGAFSALLLRGKIASFTARARSEYDPDTEGAEGCSAREQCAFRSWSLFEQKLLAGIVFATFWFEKTRDWLY